MIRKFSAGRLEEHRLGKLVFRVLSEPLPRIRGKMTLIHIQQPARYRDIPVRHRKTRELVYFIKGRVVGFLDGKKIRLKKGDVLEIPPGVWHSFLAGSGGVEAICIYIPAVNPKRPDVEFAEAGGADGAKRGRQWSYESRS